MNEMWLIWILGVIVGCLFAILWRYATPWMFDRVLFLVWYQNNIMASWVGKTRPAKWWLAEQEQILRVQNLIHTENIFDMYLYILTNDQHEDERCRLRFREADAIMDRYILREVDSNYALERLYEIKVAVEKNPQTLQSV